jgi:hypothetical protein
LEGFWYIFFLFVVLKIPVVGAMVLVWWAIRAEPVADEETPPADDHEFRRWQKPPAGPRGPRRGPHGGEAKPLPECPPGGRMRVERTNAPKRIDAASH